MGNRTTWKHEEIDKIVGLLKQVKEITDEFAWFDPTRPNFVTSENRLKGYVDQTLKQAEIIQCVGNFED